MVTLWQQKLKADPRSWLLKSNPWTRYKTLTELVDEPEAREISKAKDELVNDPMVKALTLDAGKWLIQIPTRNSDPKISYFKLRMLSDFGLNCKDPQISEIIEKAVSHREQGMFAVRGSPPKRLKKVRLQQSLIHMPICGILLHAIRP